MHQIPTSQEKYEARRKKIAALKGKTWKELNAEFSDNHLIIGGMVVMSRWEENYMRELAEIATSNGGDILEVGFGMGISASFVEKHDITSHTIIEAHPKVFEKAREWEETLPHKKRIKLLEGLWQDLVGDLPANNYDGILFDTYPVTKEEIHRNHFPFFKHAYRLLKPGGVFTYYSDEKEGLSDEHLTLLREAGFTKIKKHLCEFNPPEDCEYWDHKYIIVPEVRK
jgi:guanidinoacetate N-methyltransferase